MNWSQQWIAVALVVLAAVAGVLILSGRLPQRHRPTPLAGLAFALVTSGVVLADNQIVRYGLLAVGCGLAVLDIVLQNRPGGPAGNH